VVDEEAGDSEREGHEKVREFRKVNEPGIIVG
jgi:hypothetical protein